MQTIKNEDPGHYTHYVPPKTFVKSAVRAINVFEFFYRYRCPSRLAEISRELDLPVSSTKYLLTSLVESGYLTFNDSEKTYFPSILVAGFASWLSTIYPSGAVLRNLAIEAHEQLGEIVSIMVQHESFMRSFAIEWDEVKTPLVYDFSIRAPLMESASGNIALSTKSDSELRNYIEKECRKLAPELRKDKQDRMMEIIRTVRERGYAVKEHRVDQPNGEQESFMALAVELPLPAGSPPMALDIYGPSRDINDRQEDLVKSMQTLIERYRPLFQ